MTRHEWRTTVTVMDEDVPVTVHYEHHPLHRGSTDGKHGPKLEPDEPEHLEIDYIEGPDGEVIELTTEREEALERELGRHWEEMVASRWEDD